MAFKCAARLFESMRKRMPVKSVLSSYGVLCVFLSPYVASGAVKWHGNPVKATLGKCYSHRHTHDTKTYANPLRLHNGNCSMLPHKLL